MKLQERNRKKISNAHFDAGKSKKNMKRCRIDLNNVDEYIFYMNQEQRD